MYYYISYRKQRLAGARTTRIFKSLPIHAVDAKMTANIAHPSHNSYSSEAYSFKSRMLLLTPLEPRMKAFIHSGFNLPPRISNGGNPSNFPWHSAQCRLRLCRSANSAGTSRASDSRSLAPKVRNASRSNGVKLNHGAPESSLDLSATQPCCHLSADRSASGRGGHRSSSLSK